MELIADLSQFAWDLKQGKENIDSLTAVQCIEIIQMSRRGLTTQPEKTELKLRERLSELGREKRFLIETVTESPNPFGQPHISKSPPSNLDDALKAPMLYFECVRYFLCDTMTGESTIFD